ncbi:hypothetical protein Tco_1286162 [Tanacetum coccineum]
MMAEENVPAPTRSDAQLVPVKALLPIGKSNLLMDLQKMQKNPIFRISVDILQNTNFFSAFTASSDMYVNNLYQPWRTILTMINQCLTSKISGSDRPRHQVIQILWGVVMGTNVDYPELIWEEFVQAIKNLFSDAANLKVPIKKPKPHVIPYYRFTKLIIYDYPLGNLKFVSKGGLYEVFGMPIPKDLITDAIRNLENYKTYLEMAARKPRQPTTMTNEEGGKKKKSPPTVMKVRKGKRPDNLIDKEYEEDQPASEPQVEDDKYNLQRGITRQLPIVEDSSTGPSAQPQDDTSSNVVHDTLYLVDAETGADTEKSNSVVDTKILNVVEEQCEEVSNMVALEEKIVELDEGQAGSYPAGPNPEPMNEDFIAIVYPKVHESLKYTTKEQVLIENLSSSTETLSSMKNLDDTFTFGDQFFNDKSTEEERNKANVETIVESMVINKTIQALGSRVYTLENHDLYSKIDKQVNEVVKEAIHNALQAPLHERFRDLSEVKMKEILHDRMFEIETRNDQDPPPPPPKASDRSKKKKQDSNTSASKQPPPVDDIPIPEDVHLSDSKDVDAAHLPKIKTRLEWLKPIREEDTPETPNPN